MATTGRRGFMAILGLGAAAGPAAAKMAAQQMATTGIGGLAPSFDYFSESKGYGGVNRATLDASPWEHRGVTKLIYDAWKSDYREAQDRLDRYGHMAVNGLDPVAAVCKSWSPSYRVSHTYNRLMQLRDDARKKESIWHGWEGEPD